MQTLSRQPQFNNFHQQSRGVVFTAIILFAIGGLITGFAVGAFVRPGRPAQIGLPSQTANTPTSHKAQTPTTTQVTDHPIAMGIPVVDQRSYSETADGSTTYTFTAHAINKNNEPIHSSDITCKIWLTHDANVNSAITIDRLRSVNTLSQPFTDEVLGALNFSASTPQTQMCSNGEGTWNYTLSTTVNPGLYYVVTLMDWGGVHYNWSWVAIRVRQA